MENINELLREEIQSELADLEELEVGTDEYKSAVDGIVKLTDRAIEINKLDIEQQERLEKREEARKQAEEAKKQAELEHELKLKQMEEEKQDRLIKNCLTAAGIVIPCVITIWGTLKSFEFEKEGTVTTIMGRGFVNKLLPKK